MRYSLTEDFTEISETEGTIQNLSICAEVELAVSGNEKWTGLVILPREKFCWSGGNVKARAINGTAEVTVFPFKKGGKGGGGGKDGFSPTVTITDDVSAKTHTISITDKSGTKTAVINDGKDGANVQIGWITYQHILMPNHLKLDGSTVTASAYPQLLKFITDNNLNITAAEYATNKAMYVYDATGDTLTLPDFMNRSLQGSSVITTKEAGLPNITADILMGALGSAGKTTITSTGGTIGTGSTPTYTKTQALYMYNDVNWHNRQVSPVTNNESEAMSHLAFNASKSNPIYGNSTTVQPSAIGLIPQVRYA